MPLPPTLSVPHCIFDHMFDHHPAPQMARLPALTATEADHEAARLASALADIERRERQINTLQAEQVKAVAQYAEGRARLDRVAVWAWGESARRVCAVELADARRVGVHAAESHLNDALALVETAPKVLEKLTEGSVTLQAARAVADELRVVRPELQSAVDRIVAEEVDQVLPARARQVARTRVMEIDPAAAERATAENRRQRFVQVRPSTMVGMASLCAPLPVEQAVACWDALDVHARAARADGDSRTVSQIMADTLVERVTGLTRCTDVPVEVGLVMTDRTLLALDDRPATIPGHGPLPASLARSLAARESTWVRRLVTDPVDDTVTRVETRRRRVEGALRAFVTLRDQRCRGIGCDSKIRDIDHIDDFALGGMTSAGNSSGHCERCHHLEDHAGVTCEAVGCPDPPAPDAEHPPGHDAAAESGRHAAPVLLRWHTPIRRPMVTQAPPALGPGTSTLAQLKQRRRRLLAAKEAAAQPTGAAHRGSEQPMPAQRGPAKPGPVQEEPTQRGSEHPMPAQRGPVQEEPAQPGPAQQEPTQGGPQQPGPAQAGSAQTGPAAPRPGYDQPEGDGGTSAYDGRGTDTAEMADPMFPAVHLGIHDAA
jgi:hypothetical protein